MVGQANGKRNNLVSAERKKVAKAQKLERRRVAEEHAAIERERKAEEIAPRHARQPVLDASGRTIRGSRIVVDGAIVRRANVLDRLRAYGQEREAKGLASLITSRRVDAATRLQVDYSEMGAGVNVAATDYARATGNGNPDGRHPALLRQIATRERLEAALSAVAPMADVVIPIVLQGVDVQSWATAHGYDRKQAIGYLAAGLELLAQFYDGLAITGSQTRLRAAIVTQNVANG